MSELTFITLKKQCPYISTPTEKPYHSELCNLPIILYTFTNLST